MAGLNDEQVVHARTPFFVPPAAPAQLVLFLSFYPLPSGLYVNTIALLTVTSELRLFDR